MAATEDPGPPGPKPGRSWCSQETEHGDLRSPEAAPTCPQPPPHQPLLDGCWAVAKSQPDPP